MNRRVKQQDRVGKMNHRIELKQYSDQTDTTGEIISTWSTLAEVWAAWMPSTGASNEVEKSNRVTAKLGGVFQIRYRADIDEKMLIIWNSRVWEIRSLLPDNFFDMMMIEVDVFDGNAFEVELPEGDLGDGLLDDTDGLLS